LAKHIENGVCLAKVVWVKVEDTWGRILVPSTIRLDWIGPLCALIDKQRKDVGGRFALIW